MAQLLTALAIRRPWALVIAAGLAAMLSLWAAATRLEFRFGHTDLVSASDREYLRVLKEGYTRAALYAVVAVAALALLVFRAVVPGLLALVPLTLGAAGTLGMMRWLGVPLSSWGSGRPPTWASRSTELAPPFGRSS
jgi:hypothetical protein